jgi:drug/metabolite transporter (DMT)-like permease
MSTPAAGSAGLPPVLRAALWMVGALASFSAMAVSIRELSSDMGLFQILFWRSLIGIVVVGGLAWTVGRGWTTVASGAPRIQVLRNLVHFAGQWAWAAGIALLPLATVFALEFTTPVFAAVLAVAFLGERLNAGRIGMILLGFAGILVVLRPGADVFEAAALFPLMAAVCYAATHTFTKRLTRTDGPVVVLFWMSLIQLPLGLVPALFEWVHPSWADAPAILALGLAGLSAHYCLTSALKLADATVVVPMDFLRLPLIAVVGLLVYGEPFDPFVLLGGAIVVSGIWLGLAFERKSR